RRLLSRKAIPLEERLYLPIALGALVVFVTVLLVSVALDVDFEGQRDDQIATAFVDNWALRNQGTNGNVHLPLPLTSFPEPDFYAVVAENTALKTRFRARNHAFLESASGKKLVLVRHPLLLGNGRLLVVPATDLPQLLPPDASAEARQALVLALGLVCYLIVVRILLRRYVFEKVSLLARVVYARRVFNVTGGIPYDTHGNPIDGLWHVRTWISDKLERMGRMGNFLGRRLHRRARQEAASREGARSPKARTLPGAKGRKVLIERVSEPPHVPLERFANDELGQLALALEEGVVRLARYENQIFEAFHTVPLPTWIFDLEGNVVFTNQCAKDSYVKDQGAGRTREPNTLDALFQGALSGLPLNHMLGADTLVGRCLAVATQRLPRFTHGDVEGGGIRVCTLPAHGRTFGVLMQMPAAAIPLPERRAG
ncbi:MAG: hypothetical protein IOD12_07140, partial [Silvanigrellales bacterium]|nr:hypothetical protein [Silvanigrellales bacterium]